MSPAPVAPVLDAAVLGDGVAATRRPPDRFALAHGASHYSLIPDVVQRPSGVDDIVRNFRVSRKSGRSITFRSCGTSLSVRGVSGTRRNFQNGILHDVGTRVTVQPDATVWLTNAHLPRHGRKFRPDLARGIACTIGGVVANSSSRWVPPDGRGARRARGRHPCAGPGRRGPGIFDPRTGRLCWVDLAGGTLVENDLATGERATHELDTVLGAAVPRAGVEGFAVAVTDGFGFFDGNYSAACRRAWLIAACDW